MTNKKTTGGTVHKLPADLRQALAASPQAMATWDDVTPLARNEWICWVSLGNWPRLGIFVLRCRCQS